MQPPSTDSWFPSDSSDLHSNELREKPAFSSEVSGYFFLRDLQDLLFTLFASQRRLLEAVQKATYNIAPSCQERQTYLCSTYRNWFHLFHLKKQQQQQTQPSKRALANHLLDLWGLTKLAKWYGWGWTNSQLFAKFLVYCNKLRSAKRSNESFSKAVFEHKAVAFNSECQLWHLAYKVHQK